MKIISTNKNNDFVNNLYKELKQQAKNAIHDREVFISKAKLYLQDGVTDQECVELLVIDGLDRESASNYVKTIIDYGGIEEGEEYSFQFEDIYGNQWSSHDINKTVFASSQEEAWMKAESEIFSMPNIEPDKIISIDRI